MQGGDRARTVPLPVASLVGFLASGQGGWGVWGGGGLEERYSMTGGQGVLAKFAVSG
jgi:hypothetical protein